jgi:hypothetical protein
MNQWKVGDLVRAPDGTLWRISERSGGQIVMVRAVEAVAGRFA